MTFNHIDCFKIFTLLLAEVMILYKCYIDSFALAAAQKKKTSKRQIVRTFSVKTTHNLLPKSTYLHSEKTNKLVELSEVKLKLK